MFQGHYRFKTGFRPPEDGALGLSKKTQTFGFALGTDEAKVKRAEQTERRLALFLPIFILIFYNTFLCVQGRWVRIVSNDLENIPLGLIICWGSLFCLYSANLHSIFVIVFAVSRCFHTLSYAYSMQPHRAIAYFFGVAAVFGLVINGLLGSFFL